ncbi:hypothetical protein GQR58_018059 [Nymphon striatum]|nr:hypothetical protein GQR58_018059 [Nymphon striatum]
MGHIYNSDLAHEKVVIDMSDIWPTELRVSPDKKVLTVSFDNQTTYELTAEMLRVLSPSAEVQGHSPEQRKLIFGKCNVEIMKLEPVGNYAVRIVFDDMHDTGIFSWSYLAELGAGKEEKVE